jgi:secreted PhoX family phosphatase
MHDEGQHKVRLFATALGMTADDAEDLHRLLLQAVNTTDGQLGRRDAYGQRDTVDFLLDWRDKQAMVRSGWIIEHDSDTPRLRPVTRCDLARYGEYDQTS